MLLRISLRLLLLVAVLALVGMAGSQISSTDEAIPAFAAGSVEITVTGSGAGGSLAFTVGAGCPDKMKPGDTCKAEVTVTNTGGEKVALSAPTAEESGDLETCGGGDSLSTTFSNFSYTAATVIPPGGTGTFDVSVTLAAGATNDCQGKSGTVTVTVTATDPHDAKVEKLDSGGKDIGLGKDGRKDLDVNFACQNKSQHSDTIRCVLEISGLPAGCTATNLGPDHKLGGGDDTVVTSSFGLLVDDTSVYPKHDSKMNFDFKMRIECSPIPASAPIQLRGVADHDADDYPAPDNDDSVPGNNVRTNDHIIKK